VRPAELTIRVSPSECRIVARGEAP